MPVDQMAGLFQLPPVIALTGVSPNAVAANPATIADAPAKRTKRARRLSIPSSFQIGSRQVQVRRKNTNAGGVLARQI
jgi:uncharacterized membrane protein